MVSAENREPFIMRPMPGPINNHNNNNSNKNNNNNSNNRNLGNIRLIIVKCALHELQLNVNGLIFPGA